MSRAGVWDRLEAATRQLADGLACEGRAAGVPLQIAPAGSMFGAFFCGQPVRDWESARKSDTARFARWFAAMLDQGIYLAPSQFEAGFLSTAHGPEEIEATLRAARTALSRIS